MKKSAIIITGLSVLMLAGCGSSGGFVVDSPDAIVTITENGDNSDVTVNVENPWVETDKDGVMEATGLNIYAPEDATDAQYSYLKTGNMAQVTFTYAGYDDWTFRMQKTDMYMDISGFYYERTYEDTATVAGKEGMTYAYVEENEDSDTIDDLYGVQVINWFDDTTGISYSLSVAGKDLNGMDIGVIAENLFTMEN